MKPAVPLACLKVQPRRWLRSRREHGSVPRRYRHLAKQSVWRSQTQGGWCSCQPANSLQKPYSHGFLRAHLPAGGSAPAEAARNPASERYRVSSRRSVGASGTTRYKATRLARRQRAQHDQILMYGRPETGPQRLRGGVQCRHLKGRSECLVLGDWTCITRPEAPPRVPSPHRRPTRAPSREAF
jgi:hypothetical protein